MRTVELKKFIETRPFSVLIATGLTFLSLIGSIHGVLLCAPMFHHDPQFAVEVPTIVLMMGACALLQGCVELVTLFAFYRSNQSGYRLMKLSLVVNFVSGLAGGYFPVVSILFQTGLIAWMAYDLHEFNLIDWLEQKLAQKPAPKA